MSKLMCSWDIFYGWCCELYKCKCWLLCGYYRFNYSLSKDLCQLELLISWCCKLYKLFDGT